MRTKLTDKHVADIIRYWADAQGVDVNFILFGIDPEDGAFNGCLIDHSGLLQEPEPLE